MSYFGLGPLIRYEGALDGLKYLEILKEYLIPAYPYLEDAETITVAQRPNAIPFQFMDDNAHSHRAKIVDDWKDSKGIISMVWPANSPDINPLENIWAYIQDALYDIKDELDSKDDDVWNRTQDIWNNCPTDYIENLYNSMPKRMKLLKKEKGAPIEY